MPRARSVSRPVLPASPWRGGRAKSLLPRPACCTPPRHRRRGERPLSVLRLFRRGVKDEGGMTTAEYALGTLAACAFAGILYKVLTGGAITEVLTSLVHRALSLGG